MKNIAIGFVLGLLVAAGYTAWRASQAPEAVPGSLAPDLAGKSQTVETLAVKVYAPDVNKKLGVPEDDKVLKAIKVDDKTITAAIDAAGDTTIYTRSDPLPWFARDKALSYSLYVGSLDGRRNVRASVERSAFSVKKSKLGTMVSVDTDLHGDTSLFIAVGLHW